MLGLAEKHPGEATAGETVPGRRAGGASFREGFHGGGPGGNDPLT